MGGDWLGAVAVLLAVLQVAAVTAWMLWELIGWRGVQRAVRMLWGPSGGRVVRAVTLWRYRRWVRRKGYSG